MKSNIMTAHGENVLSPANSQISSQILNPTFHTVPLEQNLTAALLTKLDLISTDKLRTERPRHNSLSTEIVTYNDNRVVGCPSYDGMHPSIKSPQSIHLHSPQISTKMHQKDDFPVRA
jgi:DNA polymerase III epsilon subunit-like protein